MAGAETEITQELHRMSWFIIKLDEGEANGGESNGQSIYKIINAFAIIGNDITSALISEETHFKWKGTIMKGRVVAASETRRGIEKMSKSFTTKINTLSTNKTPVKLLLIQYKTDPNFLVHAIVTENEVVWPQNDCSNQDIIVQDNGTHREAKVLYISESDKILTKEADLLKNKICGYFYRKPYKNNKLENCPWLLIYYSNGTPNVYYTIIDTKIALKNVKNSYPNEIFYFKEKTAVFQAKIISASSDYQDLENKLNFIRNRSLQIQFPIINPTV